MTQRSIDLTYAYARLGLQQGASLEEIQGVLENAAASRFSTTERVGQIRRLAEFFQARRHFGDITQSHAEIKKLYHRKAMDLHPDRNMGGSETEEKFKKVNAAYRLVDEIYREAKDYYKQSEAYREEIEEEARQTTLRERQGEAQTGKESRKPAPEQKRQPDPSSAQKFMAASVPRFLRQSRLGYLPAKCVIGSRLAKGANGANIYYDVVMLPEPDFVRMRSNVGLQHVIALTPKMGETFNPAFVLSDTKHVVIQAGEPDPEKFAREYFRKEFRLAEAL